MKDFEKIGEFELSIEKLAKTAVQFTFTFTLLAVIVHYLVNPLPNLSLSNILVSSFLIIIYYILLIVLHELCHLIGFVVFAGAKFSSLKVGLDLKQGVAYATTNVMMRNKDIRKALLLPFWLTGVLPLIAGIYYGYLPLTLVGAWLIVGALGDFKMYNHLRKLDNSIYVLDDQKQPKLHLYKKTEA